MLLRKWNSENLGPNLKSYFHLSDVNAIREVGAENVEFDYFNSVIV